MSRRWPEPIFSHRDPKSPAAPLQLHKWSRLCSFGLPVRVESAEALNRPALVQSANTCPLYLLLLKQRSGEQQREGKGRLGGGLSALKCLEQENKRSLRPSRSSLNFGRWRHCCLVTQSSSPVRERARTCASNARCDPACII